MAEKNKGGRPPRILTDKEFEQVKAMVRIQCTKDEITDVMGMDEKTLTKCLKERGEAGFSDFYKKHQGEGKASLRRSQWKAATENLNPTMLVWLGKQMLGQRDQVETHNTHTVVPFDGFYIDRAEPDTPDAD
jgi:hypothetical protein